MKKILAGEEPQEPFIDGRLWYYDVDKHVYVDESSVGSKQIALAGDAQPAQQHGNEVHSPQFMAVGDPPSVHGNSKHSLYYTDAVFLSGSYLSAADVVVGSASPTNIATISFSISGTREEYLLPIVGFNYRPDPGNTANRTLQVWLNDGSNDRSAKFPVTVVLNEAKRPFSYGLAFGSSLHVGYWQSPKTGNVTLYLKGQTDQESALCSDRFFTVLRFSRQP